MGFKGLERIGDVGVLKSTNLVIIWISTLGLFIFHIIHNRILRNWIFRAWKHGRDCALYCLGLDLSGYSKGIVGVVRLCCFYISHWCFIFCMWLMSGVSGDFTKGLVSLPFVLFLYCCFNCYLEILWIWVYLFWENWRDWDSFHGVVPE